MSLPSVCKNFNSDFFPRSLIFHILLTENLRWAPHFCTSFWTDQTEGGGGGGILNRVDCWRSGENPKTYTRLKGRFVIRQNKIGREFSRKSSFSKLRTMQKQASKSLVFYQLDSCGRKRARDWKSKVFLFVFALYVALKKRISPEVRILSCLIKKKKKLSF